MEMCVGGGGVFMYVCVCAHASKHSLQSAQTHMKHKSSSPPGKHSLHSAQTHELSLKYQLTCSLELCCAMQCSSSSNVVW